MELAVHVRDAHQLEALDGVVRHLFEFYEDSDFGEQDLTHSISEPVERVYVGDEFCVHRLPDVAALENLSGIASTKGWDITLLTPPVTDDGLKKCALLFRFLEKAVPGSEVVANDWGLVRLLNERHPSLPVAAGRLLNKGFKDPRLSDADRVAQISEDAEELLKYSTFDCPEFREKARRCNIRRLERDLLPFGELRMMATKGLGTSVYFPFGYVSTGRVCWIASFNNPGRRKFCPLEVCQGQCEGLLLELGGPQFGFRMFQGGNTVFYLYPLSALGSFVKESVHKEIRMIYQGLAI